MRVLIRKMKGLGLLKLELVIGALIMAAAMIGLPAGIMSIDIALMANPYVVGVVFIGILMFASVGFFCFVRPYILYRKLPDVQAETDSEFLYIHAKKEAKIPLSELSGAYVRIELPYLLQKEFLAEFIIHLFSEEYGNVVLEIPGKGSYKMRFVSHAKAAANELACFIDTVNINI